MALQNIEDSSLCYTLGPGCLCILNVIVCIYQTQTSSPPSLFPLDTFFFLHKGIKLKEIKQRVPAC